MPVLIRLQAALLRPCFGPGLAHAQHAAGRRRQWFHLMLFFRGVAKGRETEMLIALSLPE